MSGKISIIETLKMRRSGEAVTHQSLITLIKVYYLIIVVCVTGSLTEALKMRFITLRTIVTAVWAVFTTTTLGLTCMINVQHAYNANKRFIRSDWSERKVIGRR